MKEFITTINVLNFTIGIIVGLYPFVSWKIAGKYLFINPKAALIFGFIALKLIIIGLIFYFLVKASFFAVAPFTAGMLIVPFIIVIIVLIKTVPNSATNR